MWHRRGRAFRSSLLGGNRVGRLREEQLLAATTFARAVVQIIVTAIIFEARCLMSL